VLLNDDRNGGKYQLNRTTVRRALTEQEKPEQVPHQLLSVNAELCYLLRHHIFILFGPYIEDMGIFLDPSWAFILIL